MVLLASRSAAKVNGGNPYLSFSPSLTLTADVLSTEMAAPGAIADLAAKGVRDAYTVALAPNTTTTTGSVLLVTVTGNNRDAVERALGAVTGEVGSVLSRQQAGVPRRNRITAETISFSPRGDAEPRRDSTIDSPGHNPAVPRRAVDPGAPGRADHPSAPSAPAGAGRRNPAARDARGLRDGPRLSGSGMVGTGQSPGRPDAAEDQEAQARRDRE